ncbi:MAG: hypothetical protein HQL21_05920 [Candidatus Omnitrophica bacterium]|nr:hypothetical protein [Candidatus Omnitrophota bacterium]
MVTAKKKVAATPKVAIKVPVKVSVAKNALKNVSYGAGVLVHKVSKAGKVVRPVVWNNAKKAVQKNIEAIRTLLARKMKSLAVKKSIPSVSESATASPAKSESPIKVKLRVKKEAKKPVRRVIKKTQSSQQKN